MLVAGRKLCSVCNSEKLHLIAQNLRKKNFLSCCQRSIHEKAYKSICFACFQTAVAIRFSAISLLLWKRLSSESCSLFCFPSALLLRVF